jgi:hypothetical protein
MTGWIAILCGVTFVTPSTILGQNWPQWGQNGSHTGSAAIAGQSPEAILAAVTVDPFAGQKIDDSGGDLLAHYPVPLVDGNDVYLMREGGQFVPCNPVGSGRPSPCGVDAWNRLSWSVQKFTWSAAGTLDFQWVFTSDWTPEPSAGSVVWEPVFHAVVAGGFLYVPGANGSVWRINLSDGTVAGQVAPFLQNNVFVAGPLAADGRGNVYYNAMQLDPASPWTNDVVNAWLVKIGTDVTVAMVPFQSIVAGAPASGDPCQGTFPRDRMPWPPSPDAVPPSAACGSQRPGINVSPAVGPDGTIYTVSRAHFNSRYSYLAAVNPDLTPKWTASMRGLLNDGCGVTIPYSNDGGCREGATQGVDFETNDLPAGRVVDQSSATPMLAPDGSIYYGAFTSYNSSRGHLLHFDSSGAFLNSYDFGWDITPAVWEHDGTYSIVLKDNHYEAGPFYITQLDPKMNVEWRFQSTNTQSCVRNSDGSVVCTDSGTNGFEWCVNAPAIDANGTVYVNSEDGNLYRIGQGGVLMKQLFLNWAIGAAYTPLSIGGDGKIYTQNAGVVYVVGTNSPRWP